MRRFVHIYAATIAVLWLISPLRGQAREVELSVASQVNGLEIVRLDNLPYAPDDKGDRASCSNLIIHAASPAGKDVESQGWAVTGETPLGTFEAVSFVGTFEAGTSGTCVLSNGNVGIFYGKKLVAIIYTNRESSMSIGKVIPFGPESVRIMDGDFLEATIADLRRVGSIGLIITPPAPEETTCNGSATIPYIERLPINIAREMLFERGWKPRDLTSSGPRAAGQAQDIASRGIVEVEDCSGTGLAFCSYLYQGAAAELSVTTAGEIGENGSLPWVSGYEARCRPVKP